LSVDVKEHVRTLIEALTNLSPSRNLISQLILLLPKTLSTVECSYLEITSSAEAKSLLQQHLGVEFEDMVKRASNSFSEAFYKQIHKIFDQLTNEETRSSLAKLSNVPVSSIPNPYAEWVRLVLKKLLTRPEGSKIIGFLRMLVERDSFIVYREGYSRGAYQPDWEPFLEEARKKIKANPGELDGILRFAVGMPDGDEIINVDRESGFEKTTYLKHSEYHLDLVSAVRTYSYSYPYHRIDYNYYMRRKDLLKEALKEVPV
jgi:hypothetical protein